MIDKQFEKEEFKKSVKENVKFLYRKTLEEATQEQIFQAVSYTVKDVIIDNWLKSQKAYEKQDPKIVYYMSMEFLMGRALDLTLTASKTRSRIRLLETVDSEDWQHAFWILLQLSTTVHTDAESVTVMVCSSRRSVTVIR